MIAELRASVREQTDGRFEVLGELTQDSQGSVVCLARETRERALVALSIERVGTRPDGSGQYSIEVLPELDDSLVTIGTACPVCGAASTSQSPICPTCGSALDFADDDPMAGRPKSEIMRAVRQAAGGAFDLLGEMPRAGGRGSLFFAREISSGRVVALSLRKETDESGGEFFSLGVTQVVKRPPALDASAKVSADTDADASSGLHTSASLPPGSGEPPATAEKLCPSCNRIFPPETRFCPTDGSTLLSTSPDQGLVGRTIAERYHILDMIGEGGFGKVYLAEHARMGRRCAVKIISPSMRNDADAVGRFSREAANASRINHPNVATVYDFGESEDGLIYLVMEYVDGETLADVLAREKPLPPGRSAEIARQIADALTAAHSFGIVHRDLKPQNILVTTGHDGAELVKVVDFGIAKAVQGEQQEITRAGFVIGTLEYMSPEQLLGTAVDGRSDIYSLGCVLFEMLTGESAFAGPDGPVSIGRRMAEDPPRVLDRNPAVPEDLGAIVAMTVARDAANRFQSAEGLRDALVAIARTSTEERLGVIRRSTAETAGTVGLTDARVAAATVGGAEVGRSAESPSTTAGIEPLLESRPRRLMPALVIAGVAAVALLVALFVLQTGDDPSDGLLAGAGDGTGTSALTGSGDDPSGTGSDSPSDPGTPGADTSLVEPATLYIGGTLPAGARVAIDGQVIAERSLTLTPGSHRAQITADGYSMVDTTFVVESAQVVAWSPVMRRPSTVAPAASPAPSAASSPAGSAGADPTAPQPLGEPSSQPLAGADPRAEPQPPPSLPSAALAGEQINAGIARFARALESRSIESVDGAYPGMTSTERSTWAGFLGGVRTLQVTVSAVQVPPISGENVLVPFTMTFNFTDRSGSQQTTQRYQATFVQDGTDWQLQAIRPE